MQPPIERVLGRNYQLVPRSGSMVEVCDRCYDVPLLASLQALLNCKDVRDQVPNCVNVTLMHLVIIFNSHQLSNDKLGDYCDGEQYRHHEENPCALQVTLYYDELEVCNPLGSKVSIHKLGKCQNVAYCMRVHKVT